MNWVVVEIIAVSAVFVSLCSNSMMSSCYIGLKTRTDELMTQESAVTKAIDSSSRLALLTSILIFIIAVRSIRDCVISLIPRSGAKLYGSG